MLHFSTTRDMEMVRTIMTHPKIWPYISDDGSPSVETFQPVDSEYVCYLLCFDSDEILGLWMFVQTNAVLLEVHTCLLPKHGFARSREAAKKAAEWIWENTTCQRIWTQVPKNNRIALNFAKAAGMEECGIQPQCFLKDGKLQDLIHLGVSRPKEHDVMSFSNIGALHSVGC